MLSRESSLDPLVNRVFKDTYRLTGILTSGGMGVIYRGEHLRLHLPLAIKVLRSDLPDPADLVQRLRREAMLQAMVRHPGAVKILDLDETTDGIVFIVMELCPGRSLDRIISSEAPLALDRALHIIGQILDILGAAHEARIVHADLKPENILIETLQDGSERVRILDFGVATLLQDTGGVRASRPDPDEVWGSPCYSAPEQALGRHIDSRADLYAVGVLLYEMLAGTLPIDDDDIDRFYEKLVNEPAPDIREQRRSVPPHVAGAIGRALAKLPEDRCRSASDMHEELKPPPRRIRPWEVLALGVLTMLVFLFGFFAGRSFPG